MSQGSVAGGRRAARPLLGLLLPLLLAVLGAGLQPVAGVAPPPFYCNQRAPQATPGRFCPLCDLSNTCQVGRQGGFPVG